MWAMWRRLRASNSQRYVDIHLYLTTLPTALNYTASEGRMNSGWSQWKRGGRKQCKLYLRHHPGILLPELGKTRKRQPRQLVSRLGLETYDLLKTWCTWLVITSYSAVTNDMDAVWWLFCSSWLNDFTYKNAKSKGLSGPFSCENLCHRMGHKREHLDRPHTNNAYVNTYMSSNGGEYARPVIHKSRWCTMRVISYISCK
jgi:hypothetical protein